MLGTKHSFADIKQDDVILTALKKSEDGDALCSGSMNGRDSLAMYRSRFQKVQLPHS